MDIMRLFGPYASLLLYFWLGASVFVAFVRTRRLLMLLALAAVVLVCLVLGLLSYVVIDWRIIRDPPDWLGYIIQLVIWYGASLAGVTAAGKRAGYDSSFALLFFRQPDPASYKSIPAIWLRLRGGMGFTLVSTLLLGGLSLASYELRACEALDVWFGISGCVRQIGVGDFAEAPAFSPDGATIVTADGANFINLWRVSDGQLIRSMFGHNDWVTGAQFSADGKLLATLSAEKIIVWRVNDGSIAQRITISGSSDSLGELAFAPDGSLVAASVNTPGSADYEVRIWRAADGREVTRFAASRTPTFSPDGTLLMVQNLTDGVEALEVSDPQHSALWHVDQDSGPFSFSADGARIAERQDKNITIRNTKDGSLVGIFAVADSIQRPLALAPSGTAFAAVASTEEVVEENIADQTTIHSWKGRLKYARALVYSPDGKLLASGSMLGPLQIWRVAN